MLNTGARLFACEPTAEDAQGWFELGVARAHGAVHLSREYQSEASYAKSATVLTRALAQCDRDSERNSALGRELALSLQLKLPGQLSRCHAAFGRAKEGASVRERETKARHALLFGPDATDGNVGDSVCLVRVI
jgi:hypothetical protein